MAKLNRAGYPSNRNEDKKWRQPKIDRPMDFIKGHFIKVVKQPDGQDIGVVTEFKQNSTGCIGEISTYGRIGSKLTLINAKGLPGRSRRTKHYSRTKSLCHKALGVSLEAETHRNRIALWEKCWSKLFNRLVMVGDSPNFPHDRMAEAKENLIAEGIFDKILEKAISRRSQMIKLVESRKNPK